MTDRAIAWTALVLAVVVFVLLVFHAAIPTPPAHTANGLYDWYTRVRSSVPVST